MPDDLRSVVDHRYKLKTHGQLLWTQAAFKCQDRELFITARLLIDTGASYTCLSDHLVRSIIDQPTPLRQTTIQTASDQLTVPIIAMPRFSCLGKQIDAFPIVAIPLPINSYAKGLIGMDFLRLCGAMIDIDRSEILVTK
jgi:predicted aspartyl protease